MSKIVNRTLDFFEAFAQAKKPLSLTDLMKVLDIPASSCHDVLHALEERGYVYELRSRAGFYPTSRLHEVAQTIADHDPVLLQMGPRLARLRDDLEESVFLARARGLRLTYVVAMEAASPLRVLVKVGDPVRSLFASSAGKALLGGLDSTELKQLLAGVKLERLTPHTLVSKAALMKDVEASEQRGWYLNRQETIEDMWTVSVRFAWNGSTYVVTVAGSVTRIERKLDRIARLLVAAAADLA